MLTRTDYHSATPRHVVLLEADAPEDLAPIAVAGSPHFVCLIVCADPSSLDEMRSVAQIVLDSGAAYVCTFGDDAERLHDVFDEAIVDRSCATNVYTPVITTWHDESLDEALSFALDTAYPDPELEQTCHAVVVIALGPRRYAEALHRRLADAAVDHDAKNAPRRLR